MLLRNSIALPLSPAAAGNIPRGGATVYEFEFLYQAKRRVFLFGFLFVAIGEAG